MISTHVKEKTKTLIQDLRKELRVYFPSMEFNISFEHDDKEGVTNIVIQYTDGISEQRVKNIGRLFNHSYYSSRELVKVHVSVKRSMSHEVENRLITETKSVFKIRDNIKDNNEILFNGMSLKQYIVGLFKTRDF